MLVGSPLRSRALFYVAVLALLLLIARVIYTTPSESSWLRRSQWPILAPDPQNEDEMKDSLIQPPRPNELPSQIQASDATFDPEVEPTTASESHEPVSKSGTEEKSSSGSKDSAQSKQDDDDEAAKPTDSEPEKEESSTKGGGNDHAPLEDPKNEELPCRNLPHAEDVVVIMRTGATEIQDKLPAHFETTFRCYSDLIIFSDYEEVFMGKQVHDVLKNVDERIKNDIEDFEVYNRVKAGGREALRPDELSGKLSFEGSKSGKTTPGWRLDKWKFLPMMRETLKLRPDKKWYVFVESDSYIVWSNMLKYLDALDPSRDIYYGSEVQIGEDLFAHGGSAFIMSRSAIEKAADKYESHVNDYHDLIDVHWAGDCILGIVLLEAGVELGWGWPMFQGGHPEKMDFTEEKGDVRVWCSPILSFHHFNDVELHRIWQLEQDWINVIQLINSPGFDPDAPLVKDTRRRWSFWNDHPRDDSVLHGQDVFKSFVLPNLTDFRSEWNSLSPEMIEGSAGWELDKCRKACEDDGGCVQYTHAKDGCYKSTYVMLGQPWGDVRSGWMMDRVETWMRDLDDCGRFIQDWSLT